MGDGDAVDPGKRGAGRERGEVGKETVDRMYCMR